MTCYSGIVVQSTTSVLTTQKQSRRDREEIYVADAVFVIKYMEQQKNEASEKKKSIFS